MWSTADPPTIILFAELELRGVNLKTMESVREYLLTPLATSTPFAAASYPELESTPKLNLTGYSHLYSESLHPVLSNKGKLPQYHRVHKHCIALVIFFTSLGLSAILIVQSMLNPPFSWSNN